MGSTEQLSTSQEDYLKQIYLLTEASGSVSTAALAERLSVRPPSVTGMLKKLASQGLVERVPYRGVCLTPDGRARAMRLLRLHRLLESFLHEHLGYGWEEVHDEAERLEHVISERFEQRMADMLGNPTHDPHGDPIPAADLTLPRGAPRVPLSEASTGATVRVGRVLAQDPDTLNLLAHLGVLPGSELLLVDRDEAGARIDVAGQRFLLPSALSRAVLVELVS